MDFFQSVYLKRLKVNVRLIHSRITCCLSKKCFNRNVLFPFIPWNFVYFNITITKIPLLLISKKLNFKNLTKIVLVSTMFIQRADNLAKLIGMKIILTSAYWEHIVQ